MSIECDPLTNNCNTSQGPTLPAEQQSQSVLAQAWWESHKAAIVVASFISTITNYPTTNKLLMYRTHYIHQGEIHLAFIAALLNHIIHYNYIHWAYSTDSNGIPYCWQLLTLCQSVYKGGFTLTNIKAKKSMMEKKSCCSSCSSVGSWVL